MKQQPISQPTIQTKTLALAPKRPQVLLLDLSTALDYNKFKDSNGLHVKITSELELDLKEVTSLVEKKREEKTSPKMMVQGQNFEFIHGENEIHFVFSCYYNNEVMEKFFIFCFNTGMLAQLNLALAGVCIQI